MNEQEIIEVIEGVAPEEKHPEEKKKPGRPKKKMVAIPVEVHGIVDKPANEDDVLELVYGNPTLFKKILQLLKAFEVSEVEMMFDHTCVQITARDHLGKSTIYTTIDGKCMNLYYCKAPLRICVKRDSLDKIFGTLSKSHYKITFILKENYRSTMYLIIKDIEYDYDECYEIDVVFKPEDVAQRDVRDSDADYPIKFKVSAKHFKTKITNIGKLSPAFTIQKCGEDSLQFTFDKAQKVNYTGIYNSADKIGLECSLPPDDVFNVSVYIDYIKPFSNSNIGDDVFIAADKREKISFTTYLDKKEHGYVACIKIYTEIKDYRRA